MQEVKISKRIWGEADGKEVCLFKITNRKGEFVELSNYGATLVSIFVQDRSGRIENVVLGFPLLESYVNDHCYLGSTVGRFANRIGNASFILDGKTFQLESNDGPHSNHSGSSGFHKQVFDYEVKDNKVVFRLLSPDAEGGFPGNLHVEVHYSWTDDSELKIKYFGHTDRLTLFNPTNHSYFDLSSGQSDIFGHHLSIFSDQVVDAGADYIPTGGLAPVSKSLNFKQTLISERLLQADGRITGLNICYVLDPVREKSALPAARLFDPYSGRGMELYTSYPGLMLYTGDFLDTVDPGFYGKPYQSFDGLCLEAQFFPDCPNHPAFPAAELHAGELAHHSIIFKFDTHQ